MSAGPSPIDWRRFGLVKMLPIGLLLLAGFGGLALLQQRPGMVGRPRYIFVNETDDHDHDLAFEMSLKLADKLLPKRV